MPRKVFGILIASAFAAAPRLSAQSPSVAVACPAPDVATAGWKQAVTRDSAFALLVPPAAVSDGDIGWHSKGMSFQLRAIQSPRSRRMGNDTLMAGQPFFGVLPYGETRTSVSDGEYVGNTSMCRETIDRAAAIVESGLESGGYSRLRDRRYVSVYFYGMDTGVFAWFTGSAETVEDQRLLLAIGRSIRLLRVPRSVY